MKISTFYENDSVLLVGEGNFSFSVALLQHNINIKLIATCYESVVNQIAGKKNIEYLLNNGWYISISSISIILIQISIF